MENNMRIIGIDPGYAITGYGVLDYEGNKFKVVDYGAITTSKDDTLDIRLLQLSQQLEDVLTLYKPDVLTVEELFFNTNIKTAIMVGQGRGVVILTAAKFGIKVYEYTPLQVKQAVTGYGRADKAQIQQMVKVILNLPTIPKPDDIADALAISICHAHSNVMVNNGAL
jgi:crossover junction endodeoxyribonuclease RuvC